MKLAACAKIIGNQKFSQISGNARFYEGISNGIWVEIDVSGLPDRESPGHSDFYALHIHEVGNCSLPFDQTGQHYNPTGALHPYHAGDMPPLLSNNGYASLFFFTNRLDAKEILDKSIVIHREPDDFRTQPSGNSGEKIACGVIKKCAEYFAAL